MTIRVTIKNEDTGVNRIVGVRQTRPEDGTDIPGTSEIELKGGESIERHVYDSCSLVVREVVASEQGCPQTST